MNPTTEQQAIVDAAVSGKNVSVQALAGCAKSSTLYLIAKAMPQKNMLYMAFNKTIATEASGKMPSNCECRTIHSVAYGFADRAITDKLRHRGVPSSVMANQLGLPFTTLTTSDGDEVSVSPVRLLGWVKKTTLRYMQSSDKTLSIKHLYVDPDYIGMSGTDDLAKVIVKKAKELWGMYISPTNKHQIPHDVYLKLFGLSGIDMGYDTLLCDEKQDISGVMQSILDSQKTSQKIYCGDRHQKIYSFTGSIDLKPDSSFENLTLSTSFRYGQGVADNAQRILDMLDCDQKLVGLGLPTIVDDKRIPNAVICRTNATVLSEYVHYQTAFPQLQINVSCDTEEILKFANALVELDQKGKTLHRLLKGFKSSQQLFFWLQKPDTDAEIDLIRLAGLCKKVGTSRVVSILSTYAHAASPDITITTAHKSKGLEWDCVRLSNDFPIEVGGKDNQDEELRIFYVAVTRARLCIQGMSAYEKKEDEAPSTLSVGSILSMLNIKGAHCLDSTSNSFQIERAAPLGTIDIDTFFFDVDEE